MTLKALQFFSAVLLLVIWVSPTPASSLYKWVDQKGRTHYSESPPPEHLKALPITGTLNSLSTEVPDIDFFQSTQPISKSSNQLPKLTKKDIWIFTTPTCRYCDLAKTFFQQHNIHYQEHSIVNNPQNHSWFKQLGGSGVPLTAVGSQQDTPTIIRGYNEKRFKEAFAIR